MHLHALLKQAHGSFSALPPLLALLLICVNGRGQHGVVVGVPDKDLGDPGTNPHAVKEAC